MNSEQVVILESGVDDLALSGRPMSEPAMVISLREII